MYRIDRTQTGRASRVRGGRQRVSAHQRAHDYSARFRGLPGDCHRQSTGNPWTAEFARSPFCNAPAICSYRRWPRSGLTELADVARPELDARADPSAPGVFGHRMLEGALTRSAHHQ